MEKSVLVKKARRSAGCSKIVFWVSVFGHIVVKAQVIVIVETLIVQGILFHFIYVEVLIVNPKFFFVQVIKAVIKIVLFIVKYFFFWFKFVVVVCGRWSADKRSRSGCSDCECLVLHS